MVKYYLVTKIMELWKLILRLMDEEIKNIL